MTRTAVVILNWNTSSLLEKFLPQLISSCEGLDAEVVVADNASTDSSASMLAEKFPQLRLIPLDRNYGFTGGYNRALEQVQADYFVLLNSDIEVTRGWLSPLVEWMDSHPLCAACAPKLLSWYDRTKLEYAGAAGGFLDFFGYPFCRGRVPGITEVDTSRYDSMHDGVLWVSGACIMIRASVWKQLGGLDESFFAHMEEIDFCWRAQLAGFSINTVPQSQVFHMGGGTLPATSPFKLHLNYRNNLLMLAKNLPATIGRGRARVRIFSRMALDCGAALVYLLTGKKAFFAAVAKAHREFRQMRPSLQISSKADGASVQGLLPLCIIPLRAILGKRTFNYIHRYENCHRRSR